METARRSHRMLARIALSGAHMFAWIVAFQYYYVQTGTLAGAFASLALTYALTHTIVTLLSPYGAQKLRNGVRRMMVFATLAAAAAFIALGAAFFNFFGSIGWGVGLFACLIGVYRSLYWIPYQLSGESARQPLTVEMLIALMPALAGIFLTFGMSAPALLFFFAGGLLVLSLIPLAAIPEFAEGYAWSYRQTFHELFSSHRKRVFAVSLLDGIESAALFFVWPVVAFVLLNGSYPYLGIVMSITFLITMIVRPLIRGTRVVHESTPIVALIACSGWIMRFAVGSPLGIVLIDTYLHSGAPARGGMDIHIFEQVSDNGTYIDEHTALKEMGNAIGRILLALLVVAAGSFASFSIMAGTAFILAAVAAPLSITLARKKRSAVF